MTDKDKDNKATTPPAAPAKPKAEVPKRAMAELFVKLTSDASVRGQAYLKGEVLSVSADDRAFLVPDSAADLKRAPTGPVKTLVPTVFVRLLRDSYVAGEIYKEGDLLEVTAEDRHFLDAGAAKDVPKPANADNPA